MSWYDSYVGQLRRQVGHQKLIVPSIRAIIQDQQGSILFIRRRGNGKWALPAGSIELDESIFDCLKREVLEETGLIVVRATLISIYTAPRYSITNQFGDEYQGFEFLYRVDEWEGKVLDETNETCGIGFFPIDAPPLIEEGYWEEHHKEVMEDNKNFIGVPIIK